MSLADKLAAPPPAGIHGKPCSVGSVYDALDPDEQAAMDHMLANWTDPRTLAALVAEGFTGVGLQQIGIHRRGQCRCAKKEQA